MRPIKEDKGRVRPVVEDDFQCDENGNSTRIYEVLSIVGYAKADGTKLGYISKTNVPIGIPITDTKYWYPFQVIGVPKGDKGDKGDRGDDGKSAYDLYIEHGGTITPVEAWIASLQGKDGRNGRDGRDGVDGRNGRDGKDGKDGKDGRPLQLRISSDGQSIEISSDGGETWYVFEKNFSKLRVLGYIDSISDLPRNANIGDIYGVRIPDEEVEEDEEYTYNLYINTVVGWNLDYTITKVYDYDTELPSSAADGTTVLVPVDYLTLDKEKIDGYKVYRFSLEKNGWVLILDTAEIYASKEDIINHGDNVYALVQGDEENTYKLYKRVVGWVYFGTNASITYVLVQDVNEGTETNILSGKAVKDAYGHYIESPEFLRAYLDDEDKILWGIKTDGTVYFGAGVPPQVKDYIEERIGNYDDIITFLDDLEEGDETLRELFNKKVDKEEGKSLIDEEYAEGVHYIESPEFIEVKLDQNDKILEATMLDGTKLLPAGYEVGGNVVKAVSNPEFLSVELDSEDKVLGGRKIDGTKFENVGLDLGGAVLKGMNDPEGRMEVKIDSDEKIVSYRKKDGTLVENVGIKTNHLKLTEQGMTDFQQDLKNTGFKPIDNSDKTILWLGTSIPGGWAYSVQVEGQVVNNAYPDMVGVLLGCNVINKAMGSSRIACGWRSNVTENNPYGIPQGGSGEGFRRSLLHTVAEKQEIIDNFDAYKAAYNWTVDTLNESEKRIMLNNCSYESILIPYLDGTYDAPDIIVIDHGHNDSYINDTDKGSINNRTDRLTFYGGYNIVVDLIRRYNRNIKIVQVAHFISGTEYEQLIESQRDIARKNGVIFCPLYDIDGWDAEGQIKTRGRWNYSTPYSSYNWATWEDNVLDSDAFMSVKAYHLPDGVHPHSDMSGQQNKELAYAIAGWLRSVFGFIK